MIIVGTCRLRRFSLRSGVHSYAVAMSLEACLVRTSEDDVEMRKVAIECETGFWRVEA
jgi:hypothetical protein